jgi:hypothetical protein
MSYNAPEQSIANTVPAEQINASSSSSIMNPNQIPTTSNSDRVKSSNDQGTITQPSGSTENSPSLVSLSRNIQTLW